MNFTEPKKSIFEILHFFSEPNLRQEILEQGKILEIQKGETVIREGQYLGELPIVLSGSIRVFHQSEDREVLLYYVNPSNTCMMSLSACFFNNPSQSVAATEEDTKILSIPSFYITDWQKKYNSWNSFIIETFKTRYDELLNAFEAITFSHTDSRIWDYLKTYSQNNSTNKIPISHQKLANELGTTRVVISRILKQYENDGKLTLHRRTIELL
jgi:CRP/FNR family transcriptional regulator